MEESSFRAHDAPKKWRILQIFINEVIYDDRNRIVQVQYSFVKSPKIVSWDKRKNGDQMLSYIEPRKYYYVVCRNTNFEIRPNTNWVWEHAQEVTREQAQALYRAHQLHGQNEMLDEVLLDSILKFGDAGEIAWCTCKARSKRAPTQMEVTTEISIQRDKFNFKVVEKAKSMLKEAFHNVQVNDLLKF